MSFAMLVLACVCFMFVTLIGTMLGVQSFARLMTAQFFVTFVVLWGVSSYMSFAASQLEVMRTSFWIAAATAGFGMIVRAVDRRFFEPRMRRPGEKT